MKKFLFILYLMVLIFSISACSEEKDPNLLKVSKSSDEMVGKNYETVISELEKIGFTNIETKILDDLITGWLTKDGEIEQVEINGVTEFSSNDDFQKDSKIVITYHTFPKEEDSDNESIDKKSSETVEQTAEVTSEEEDDIITAENNNDFAAVLATRYTNDTIIAEFAQKYAGRAIEFDGSIVHMMPHGDYKTRYDILIHIGDYSETTSMGGPNFKFEDVNIFDLNLTGSEIPDTIGIGQNLHIIAEVEKFNETQELFFLKPISTGIR